MKEEVESGDGETIKIGTILNTLKKSGNFLNRYKFLLLILIPILLTWTIREYHNDLPVTDDWARSNVENFLRSQVSDQINSQYPTLPTENKNILIEKQLNQLLLERKEEVYAQVKGSSQYFKDYFKDENGYTYLSDIDSYYYYRHAMNIIRYGHEGNVLINGIPHDTFIGAPHTTISTPLFHSRFSAFVYKILRLFDDKITVMRAFSYVPTIIAILTAIFAYLIGKRISGDLAGLFISVLVSVQPTFISRSIGGDTDVYNVFFPILLAWLFIEALSSKSWKGKIIYSTVLGAAMGVFSFAWQSGWTHMWDILIATMVLYYITKLVINRAHFHHGFKKFLIDPYKKFFATFAIFFVSTGIFVTIINGFASFVYSFTSVINFIRLKDVATSTLWPNINTTIAELNSASISDMIGSMGGWLLFLIASMGIIFAIFRKEKLKTIHATLILCSLIYYFVLIKYFANTEVIPFVILMAIPIAACFFFIVKTKDNEINFLNGVLLSLWFLITIASIKQGVRFLLLILPPFLISIAFTVDFIFKFASHTITTWAHKEKHLTTVFIIALVPLILLPFQNLFPNIIAREVPAIVLKSILIFIDLVMLAFLIFGIAKKKPGIVINVTKVLVVFFILLLLVRPVDSGDGSTRGVFPMMNDVWYNSLNEIKMKSQSDAIINSWWDYGHWFKAIADRRTTFDGGFQVGYGAYWVGKSLLTPSEHATWGILRMLDCGANEGFTTLNSYIKHDPTSVDILNAIIVVEKDEAKEILKEKGLDEEAIAKVLNLTHCSPPENYYIASEDMVGKSGVWAHFGSWDFNRSEMHNKVLNSDYPTGIKILKEEFGLDSTQAEQYYNEIKESPADRWIAPWPSYASGVYRCSETTGVVRCENGIEFVIADKKVTITTPNGITKPNSFVYYDEDEKEVKEKVFDKPDIPYSFALFQRNGQWESIIMMPELAQSMFTKLFFFEGKGLNHFDLFYHQKGFSGTDVYVYKLNWAGKDNSKAEEITGIKKESPISVSVS